MSALFDQVLFNAAMATLIAPVALASRFFGRPMLTHTLWLIVLVRLVVPPVYSISLPATSSHTITTETLPLAIEDPSDPIEEEFVILPPLEEAVPMETPAIVPIVRQIPSMPWWEITLGIWACVAIGFWGRLIFHAFRFQQLLCYASPANESTNALVAKLSRRLGLRRPPKVVMVPARLSPCVWCFSTRPTLLLPEDWTNRQHRLNRAAVLVHELAHLRRGDHWVRWFELFVTGLYWWLPTVWFARHHLRDAEELCCDGWVIATLPAARQAYATALIDMADYLTPLRPALPPLASGFGQVHELRRRLHMILHSKPSIRVGRSGAVIALGLGLFLLPVGLVRSQEREQEQPPPPRERTERREADEARTREQAERERTRAVDQRDRAEAARRDAVTAELRAELADAQKRLNDAQRAVERIRQRMNEMGVEAPRERTVENRRILETPRPSDPARGEGRGGAPGGRGGVARGAGPDGPPASEARGGGGRGDLPPEPPRTPRAPVPPKPAQPPEPPRGVPGVPFGGGGGRAPAARDEELDRALRTAKLEEKKLLETYGEKHPSVVQIRKHIETMEKMDRDDDRRGGFGGGGSRTTPVPIRPSDRSADDRVQSLEKQLEMLRRELEAMRREMRPGSGERRPPEPRSENPPARP